MVHMKPLLGWNQLSKSFILIFLAQFAHLKGTAIRRCKFKPACKTVAVNSKQPSNYITGTFWCDIHCAFHWIQIIESWCEPDYVTQQLHASWMAHETEALHWFHHAATTSNSPTYTLWEAQLHFIYTFPSLSLYIKVCKQIRLKPVAYICTVPMGHAGWTQKFTWACSVARSLLLSISSWATRNRAFLEEMLLLHPLYL